MSSLAKVDLVFEVFSLVLAGEETCFVWQIQYSSFGKVECFWSSEDEILCLARMVIELAYIFINSAC